MGLRDNARPRTKKRLSLNKLISVEEERKLMKKRRMKTMETRNERKEPKSEMSSLKENAKLKTTRRLSLNQLISVEEGRKLVKKRKMKTMETRKERIEPKSEMNLVNAE